MASRPLSPIATLGAAVALALAAAPACSRDEAPAPVPAAVPAGSAQLPPGHPPVEGLPSPPPAETGMPPGHPPLAGGARAPRAPGHPPMAPGHPPMVPGATAPPLGAAPPPIEEGQQRPLLLTGSGSVAELEGRLKDVADADARKRLEEAFRLTFTAVREQRDPAQAARLLEGLEGPTGVQATRERILGYVAVSTNFDAARAMKHYLRAVELEPGYGEAQYALAFMYVMSDREAGRRHYQEAMRLGVPDDRNLARYFGSPDAAAPPTPPPTPGH